MSFSLVSLRLGSSGDVAAAAAASLVNGKWNHKRLPPIYVGIGRRHSGPTYCCCNFIQQKSPCDSHHQCSVVLLFCYYESLSLSLSLSLLHFSLHSYSSLFVLIISHHTSKNRVGELLLKQLNFVCPPTQHFSHIYAPVRRGEEQRKSRGLSLLESSVFISLIY